MTTKPPRPYYDAEAAAKRKAARLAELRAGLGAVVVRRPSDATMRLIEKWKSEQAQS